MHAQSRVFMSTNVSVLIYKNSMIMLSHVFMDVSVTRAHGNTIVVSKTLM